MERHEAVDRLMDLKGKDLHQIAHYHGVTVTRDGRINKGWAGHTIERYLGLPLNSSQSPNFGSWELKVIPLKYLKSGKVVIKETMAITMIDPVNIVEKDFENSHLYAKLKKAVCVARIVGETAHDPSYVVDVVTIDLKDETYSTVEEDYEIVRQCIADPTRGFDQLTGKMGTYIQPRTKGAGHGSTSRAFYARKDFLKLYLNL